MFLNLRVQRLSPGLAKLKVCLVKYKVRQFPMHPLVIRNSKRLATYNGCPLVVTENVCSMQHNKVVPQIDKVGSVKVVPHLAKY